MSYTLYDTSKPDWATQTGTGLAASIRQNEAALRDACILGGGFPGFNLSVSGGTASQPGVLLYTKGTERVRATLTWGTVGGENGNVTSIVFAYSANGGTTYDTIGTKTVSYDGSANVTSSTWS